MFCCTGCALLLVIYEACLSSFNHLQFASLNINHQSMHWYLWQIWTVADNIDHLFHIHMHIVKCANPHCVCPITATSRTPNKNIPPASERMRSFKPPSRSDSEMVAPAVRTSMTSPRSRPSASSNICTSLQSMQVTTAIRLRGVCPIIGNLFSCTNCSL